MDVGNAVRTAIYTMLTVTWCHSECCVPSGFALKLLVFLLYIIIIICFEGIKLLETWHGRSCMVKCQNTQKSTHPPVWQTCKVLCPWVLFHETTVHAHVCMAVHQFWTTACMAIHVLINFCRSMQSYTWLNEYIAVDMSCTCTATHGLSVEQR